MLHWLHFDLPYTKPRWIPTCTTFILIPPRQTTHRIESLAKWCFWARRASIRSSLFQYTPEISRFLRPRKWQLRGNWIHHYTHKRGRRWTFAARRFRWVWPGRRPIWDSSKDGFVKKMRPLELLPPTIRLQGIWFTFYALMIELKFETLIEERGFASVKVRCVIPSSHFFLFSKFRHIPIPI
jgi:hypothetical protein